MFQFQRAQNPDDPIQNVVFYGETTEYIRLTAELEKQDVMTSLLGVPSSVGGYENFDFQSYANAIGAMFKSNRDIERINLLEIDASQGKAEAGASFAIGWIGSALLSAAIIGGIYVFFMIRIDQMDTQIKEIDDWINSEATVTKIQMVDDAQSRSNKITQYGSQILIASDNFITQPKLSWEVLENIRANETGSDSELDATIKSLNFAGGVWTASCSAPDSYGPSRFIQNMEEQDIFREIQYSGYTLEPAEEAIIDPENPDTSISAGEDTYNFNITFIQAPNLTPAEAAAAEEARLAAEEAARLEAEANGGDGTGGDGTGGTDGTENNGEVAE
jgi:type IV pilus assembly protein PilM